MHSRFGIAFTGVIQVLCSAVMSFSVMAFLGFGWGDTATRNAHGETVVPYYLMPLVILIVGVENMATLVSCQAGTPQFPLLTQDSLAQSHLFHTHHLLCAR